MSIQEILESAGLPAQRGVYTGRDKPDAYYTFLRLLGTPAVNADDEEKERREMYRVKNNKDIAAKSACGTPQALILYAERQEI